MSQQSEFAVPEIRMIHHRAKLFVDGQALPPMAFCVRGDEHKTVHLAERRAQELSQANFRLFVIFMQSGWHFEDDAAGIGWDYTEHQANCILDTCPEACFLLRLDCRPSKKWFDENPNELVMFEDGSRDRFRAHRHGTFTDHRQVCYASEKYARDAAPHIRNAIDFVESCLFGKRVIGYHVEGGCCGEWNYLRDTRDGICGDFSPAFKTFYSTWLNEKYGNESALRQAWRMPEASLSEPRIPTSSEQVFSEGEIAHNGRRDPEGDWGNFLDPEKSQFLIDYYEARTAGTARTIERMAEVIKDRTNHRALTGAFWGTMLGVSAQTYAICGPLFLANSPHIDYLTTPSQYYDRQPGGGSTFRVPVDSIVYRGKLWINESDSRTHLADDHNKTQFCRCHSMTDTANVLNRDFAQVLCDDVHGWWFEMAEGGHSFYDDPAIVDLFSRQQKIARDSYTSAGKATEIAVVYDQKSMFSHPFESTRDLLAWNRSQTIPRIGAPCDHIFHNDLLLPNLPDYKMYIFLNCHSLTSAERTAVNRKVKRRGAIVVWAYANGLIQPDASPAMSTEHMHDLTGFRVAAINSARPVTFRLTDTVHELTRNLSPLPLYGRLPRPLQAGFSFLPGECMVMDETLAWPMFYVADKEARVLGRFVANDKPAFAVKPFDSWTSVYIGAKILPATILRAIARKAGVHIYLDDSDRIWPFRTSDIVYASQQFVAVTADVGDKKTVRFPTKVKSVRNALTGRELACDRDSVTLRMDPGETKLLQLIPY
ncbi:MAG: hypothetical protein K9N51_02815 [Candidatus Pacebacteria bacterium]|nr:hypothetical protein [Candidatus Paceibacterota bacterium]